MKQGTIRIFVLIAVLIIAAIAVSTAAAAVLDDEQMSLNWESEPVEYKHFTDLGHYVLKLEDADYSNFETEVLPTLAILDDPFNSGCTASVKKNAKGEVIIGRNMDVEISQNPAYVTRIKGGKYDTVSFTYPGVSGRYTYSQLAEHDEDTTYLSMIPYMATDAMNETGLYVETNMREMDNEFDLYCRGTNPGQPRANMISVPTLIALNCSTVAEAWEFLQHSYDWFSLGLPKSYHDALQGDAQAIWNLAFIVGDANGDYGLFEFAMNEIYYTPYPNGQGNYYIHPEIAQYAVNGTGYGRFASTLIGLPYCETEWDMMYNMNYAMWRNEILFPGFLGYSDFVFNINDRRTMTEDEMQEKAEKIMEPYQPLAMQFYAGNEKPLRDNANVWTTSFNFGVNCHTKHLILRLFEDDTTVIQYQW